MSDLAKLFIAFLFIFPQFAVAQAGMYNEEEMTNQALFMEGERERLLGNHEKAIFFYKALLDKDDKISAVHYELARIYDGLEENESAMFHSKLAVNLDPQNEWYQMFLGDLAQKVGDDEKAAEVYKTLIKQHPNNDYYYYKQAYFLVRANEPNDAMKIYENLEKRIGINEELTRRKHTLYVGLGDYKKAEKELLKLIEVFPSDLDYRHLLADFYTQIKDDKKAKETYKYILERDPNDTDAMVALSSKKSISGNELQYIQSMKPLFENPEVNIDAKVAQIFPLVQKVAQTEDKALAEAVLELANALEIAHPDDAKAYSISADLLYYAGRKKDAAAKYKKTTEINETVYLVWEQYLTTLNELGEWEELLNASENALDVFPNQGTVQFLNAKAYGRTGKHKQALSSLQMARAMAGNSPRLQFDVAAEAGFQHTKLKQFDKANTEYVTALKLNPNDAKITENYGDMFFQAGDADAAVVQWKKALQRGGDKARLERKISERSL